MHQPGRLWGITSTRGPGDAPTRAPRRWRRQAWVPTSRRERRRGDDDAPGARRVEPELRRRARDTEDETATARTAHDRAHAMRVHHQRTHLPGRPAVGHTARAAVRSGTKISLRIPAAACPSSAWAMPIRPWAGSAPFSPVPGRARARGGSRRGAIASASHLTQCAGGPPAIFSARVRTLPRGRSQAR